MADIDHDGGSASETELSDTIETTYSREATIAAVKSYYEFLTSMYMDPSIIVTPPEDGWPEITVEIMREFGKADEVIELLRRLPYIRPPTINYYDEVEAAAFCQFADWSALITRPSRPLSTEKVISILLQTQSDWQNVPAHVVGLSASEYFQIFLDTQLGLIYFIGHDAGPGPVRWAMQHKRSPHEPIRDDLDDDIREEQEWRSDYCWATPEFFKLLEWHFRELDYVPISHRRVIEDFDRGQRVAEESGREPNAARVQEIFREHGWPDLARYDKDECIKAVMRVTEER